MFAVKAKINGVLYNQSSSIAFDETSIVIGMRQNTGVIPKSLPMLLSMSVLRKAAVDQGLRFSTEQYGC